MPMGRTFRCIRRDEPHADSVTLVLQFGLPTLLTHLLLLLKMSQSVGKSQKVSNEPFTFVVSLRGLRADLPFSPGAGIGMGC
jgi:hypothetical protein